MDKYIVSEQAFLHELADVIAGNTITARGSVTKEQTSKMIRVMFPEKRCYFIPERNDNIFAKVAETLWMLAGRNDIDWLSYYLPRVYDFSDDGKTWRGAYGPRLRNWNGVDQIAYVLTQLNLDPFTRQAVISIWDPEHDTIEITKDRPCNNWLQFYARDNRDLKAQGYTTKLALNMDISQRSCDVFWGYSGIDTFSWSVLQQMMAFWTGNIVGESNHHIGSLHLYERHWNRAKILLAIANAKFVDIDGYAYCTPYMLYSMHTPKFSTPFADFDDKLKFIFSAEEAFRETIDENCLEHYTQIDDEFLRACYLMMCIYIMHKQSMPISDIGYVISLMPDNSDFRMATIEYLCRSDKSLLQYVKLTQSEADMLRAVYNIA